MLRLSNDSGPLPMGDCDRPLGDTAEKLNAAKSSHDGRYSPANWKLSSNEPNDERLTLSRSSSISDTGVIGGWLDDASISVILFWWFTFCFTVILRRNEFGSVIWSVLMQHKLHQCKQCTPRVTGHRTLTKYHTLQVVAGSKMHSQYMYIWTLFMFTNKSVLFAFLIRWLLAGSFVLFSVVIWLCKFLQNCRFLLQ